MPRAPGGGGVGHGGGDGGGQKPHEGDTSEYTRNGVHYHGVFSGGTWHWSIGGGGGTGGGGGGSYGYGGGGGYGGSGTALTTTTGRKLSQAQLDALKSDYRHVWNMYFGKDLTGAQLTHLAQMDLSASEFLDRVKVLEKARTYAPFYHQLQNTLRARGALKPNEKLDVKQFILGRAPASFYNIYTEASARTGLVSGGLHIGAPKRGDEYVSHGFLHQLIGTLGRDAILSNSATVQKLYTDLANEMINVLPEARFADYGVDKKDILTSLVGGRGSAEQRARIQQLLVNKQARGTTTALEPAPQQGQDSGYTTSSL